jgi:hypothetical protein
LAGFTENHQNHEELPGFYSKLKLHEFTKFSRFSANPQIREIGRVLPVPVAWTLPRPRAVCGVDQIPPQINQLTTKNVATPGAVAPLDFPSFTSFHIPFPAI